MLKITAELGFASQGEKKVVIVEKVPLAVLNAQPKTADCALSLAERLVWQSG